MADMYLEPVSVRVTNPNLNVGVLDVPDSYPKVVLYDDKKAVKNVREINHDIYQVQQHPNPDKNRKVPKGVWFILASTAIAGIVLFVKFFVKK